MRIAIIGQSVFASKVLELLQENGHQIVGVFTIDTGEGREDPLALTARSHNVPVFKIKRWRLKTGKVIESVFTQYKSVQPELNVLPYCTQFIPMEVINYPVHQSICYHPSLLPRHRGAAAINWTLIEGDSEAGFSIFWPDDGLDTGPILLQRRCHIEPDDTVESLYNRFLFPEGIIAFGESIELIVSNQAPRIEQSEHGATYDPMLNKEESTVIDFSSKTGEQLHNFIRGMDKVPGARLEINDEKVKVFGSKLLNETPNSDRIVSIKGMTRQGLITDQGLVLFGIDDKSVLVRKLQKSNGKMINASDYGLEETSVGVELTEEEVVWAEKIREIWSGILRIGITDETDFFQSGAGSMDVTRMIEEIREKCSIHLTTEDVYSATAFNELVNLSVLKLRGASAASEIKFDSFEITVNKLNLKIPTQLFIDNQFVNSVENTTIEVVNPTTEEIICHVQAASGADVDRAVHAAKSAFETGEWGRMNARDRGKIMFKLADLMEEIKEELATIESIDSGAVYTLALKTHIGMSIDSFRYFAGWCDKILGSTIPINNARPNRNLSFTKREPIGVCGIITPWNYPLMMVSWKTAACLAAGNTVVLKPTHNCPLTSLKLGELIIKAGFPRGVVNIIPGGGHDCGRRMVSHPLIRKLAFTGSTPVGKDIMRSCAENLKKVSLELGGKSPLIIFGDADLDKAVRNAMGGVFFNKGENCIAAGRIFVEDTIHDRFVQKVVTETKKIVVGDPLDRSTSHGPQNHLAHLERLIAYCERGVKDGARLIYGGRRVSRKGYFLMPTIFTDVTDEMYIAHEESFGPIMIVSKFKAGDIDGVIERANGTEYGLASGVFTSDISKAFYVSDRIEAGTCFINCYNKTDVAAPFGGCKQSGFGKDLGKDALNEYLKTKTVTVEY